MFGACHASSLISGNWHHLGSHQQEGLQSDCCHHQWPDSSHHWQQLKNSGDLRIYMLYIMHPICVIASFRSKIHWTLYMYVCICTCIYTLNILSHFTNVSWYDICGVVHVYNCVYIYIYVCIQYMALPLALPKEVSHTNLNVYSHIYIYNITTYIYIYTNIHTICIMMCYASL